MALTRERERAWRVTGESLVVLAERERERERERESLENHYKTLEGSRKRNGLDGRVLHRSILKSSKKEVHLDRLVRL